MNENKGIKNKKKSFYLFIFNSMLFFETVIYYLRFLMRFVKNSFTF